MLLLLHCREIKVETGQPAGVSSQADITSPLLAPTAALLLLVVGETERKRVTSLSKPSVDSTAMLVLFELN
jgi:hypothetical protein